jgi:hypothetical protein
MLHSSSASADVSSWLSAGGGYGMNYNNDTSAYSRAVTMSFAVGVGTESSNDFVVGGLVRGTTYLSLGTDVGVAARIATGGFARGQWGLALDLGPTWRTFGQGEYGRWPIAGRITGGAPWGVQLAIGGELLKVAGDDASARGIVALLELDLLRLTVMRRGATDRWWENPSPAGGEVHKPTPPAPPPPLAGLLW